MQKHKDNLFLDRFRLLNSQEHTEDINWSSSGSSDYEDTSINSKHNNSLNNSRIHKRKRKKKVPMNISNLNVTILDTSRKSFKATDEEKSPILCSRAHRKSASLSPILVPLQAFPKVKTITSPILAMKNIHQKSPVLVPKSESPVLSKVRKKLFNKENADQNKNFIKQTYVKKEVFDKESTVNIEARDTTDISAQIKEENETEFKNSQEVKLELVKQVKSFFESHFSSDNTPFNSQAISQVLSPQNSTRTSEEIEILTCKTQKISSTESLKQENSYSSDTNNLIKNTKKVRYKKDGLAYCLGNLLKKQNASYSLWHHEKFMAANSNFVIPKGECSVFRIQTVQIKYGCHLFETVDSDDEIHFIVINNNYITETILSDMIIKIYEPFKVLQFNESCKLIVNVLKFELYDYLNDNKCKT